MNARKLNNIISSYSNMTAEAAKKIKFVFIKSIDLNSYTAPCYVFTLEELRKKVPFIRADQAIWFEKNINRELSVIYEDFSLCQILMNLRG